MEWIERKTVTYDLKSLDFEEDFDLQDPSKVRLVTPGYVFPYDFGAWCYGKRKKSCNEI